MDLLFIILVALIFASVLTGPVGWRHARASNFVGAWIFVLIVLLPLLWLTAVWLPPAGPAMMGVYWVGPVAAGLLIILLLAAVAPPPRRLPPGAEPKPGQDQLEPGGTGAIFVDVAFWLFLLGAIGLALVGLFA